MKKIAHVQVPKTAHLPVNFFDKFCEGFISFEKNGVCGIKHETDHMKMYRKGPWIFSTITLPNVCLMSYPSTHVSAGTYMKFHDHDHYFFSQVRDPYDVACSLYFHLIRNDYGIIRGSNIDVNYYNSNLIAKKAKINDFLESMKHDSLYTHYFDELDPEDFDCMGYSQQLGKTSMLLHSIFDINVLPVNTKINPDKTTGKFYNFDFSRNDFKKLNEQDYDLYYRAINKFNTLCKKYL